MPTAIPWTDETWNPWQGCTKISCGCRECYMYREKISYGQDPTKVIRSSKTVFDKPFRLKPGTAVFTCSWSDFFHIDADAWRREAWSIIRLCNDLLFIILTKRPERIAANLPEDWGNGYSNVIMGITAEDQGWFNLRWPILQHITAAGYLISHEPAYGGIIYPDSFLSLRDRAWVIAGGESGNNAYPSHLYWFRQDRDQCNLNGVPFFFKAWGEWVHGLYVDGCYQLQNNQWSSGKNSSVYKWPGGGVSVRIGREVSGEKLDGKIHHEFPNIRLKPSQTSIF